MIVGIGRRCPSRSCRRQPIPIIPLKPLPRRTRHISIVVIRIGRGCSSGNLMPVTACGFAKLVSSYPYVTCRIGGGRKARDIPQHSIRELVAVRSGGGQGRRGPGEPVQAIVGVCDRLPCPCDRVVRYVRDVAVCIVSESLCFGVPPERPVTCAECSTVRRGSEAVPEKSAADQLALQTRLSPIRSSTMSWPSRSPNLVMLVLLMFLLPAPLSVHATASPVRNAGVERNVVALLGGVVDRIPNHIVIGRPYGGVGSRI